MPVTPPPPSRSVLRTPPAPLHGDNYEPYAPRRSIRTAKKPQAGAQTPPPVQRDNNALEAQLSTPRTNRRTTVARHATFTFSPPSSAQSSPMKKAGWTPSAAGRRSASGTFSFDNTATAASSLGLSMDDSSSNPSRNALHAPVVGPGMLPTPAKTPKKRPPKPASALGSTARVLFPSRPQTVEEAMPTPRKNRRAKKSEGFNLGGVNDEMGAEDEEEKIYTDSKERIPELDLSDDNPFLSRSGQAEAAEESRRLRKRRKVAAGGSQEVEDSLERDDGMFVVFRGKKKFIKFGTSQNVDDDIDGTDGPDTLTRTSVKPRLLFPNKDQVRVRESRAHEDAQAEASLSVNEVDEEAVTDVDEETRITLSQEITTRQDQEMEDSEMRDAPETPKATIHKNGASASSISFNSPPASGTRSATRAGSSRRKPGFGGSFDSSVGSNEHMTRSKGRPFDNWSRTKGLSPSGTPRVGSGSGSGKVKKRGAASSSTPARVEAVTQGEESVSKRTRASSSG